LFEAVKPVVPDWWLLHPVDAAAVRVFADAATPRTVVWLDELQRYLTQPGGVPVGTVRALLAAKVLVAATLWPGEYTARTALRIPGQPDPYAEDRELLGLARVVEVPDMFSAAERTRAGDLVGDQRIRAALATRDAGVTQVLAAGPELIRWWEHADVSDARQCYGKAVITAALDARRVGAAAALTRDFLITAAPAYLSSAQLATAESDWFDQAIGYATTRLHGATACLSPVAAGIGQIAGWMTQTSCINTPGRCAVPIWCPLRCGKRSSSTTTPTTPSNSPPTPSGVTSFAMPSSSGAGPPMQAPGTPPSSWLVCWASRAVSMGCGSAPPLVTCMPPISCLVCWPSRAVSTRRSSCCGSVRTPVTCMPPISWLNCWPSKALSTNSRRRSEQAR
jgi:hypothetical protein